MTSTLHLLRLGCSAAVTLLLFGCGGAADPNDGLDQATLAQQVKDLAEQARTEGHVSQFEIMRDGIITDAEYRQAYVDAVSCYERAGVRVEGPTQVATVHGHDYTFIHADMDPEDDCETRFVMRVNMGWNTLYQNVLTPEARALAAECFQRHGIDAADLTTLHDFLDADKPTFDTCLWETATAVADPPGEVIFGY